MIFLVIWGCFLIRDRIRFNQTYNSLYRNEEYTPGKSVEIQDEDYISGIEFSKNLEYEKAEEFLLKVYERTTDKTSPEYAKISQSIGVLYLLMYRFEEASEYLMDSYISFRDSLGEEEENTIVARCLIAYCDCLNGNSDQAFADLDDIFWTTNQPELSFITHILILKAYNELGQYKRAYDSMLVGNVALQKVNYFPEEFQSPVLPDVSLWNYHEIIGDIYAGLECYFEARTQYLLAGEFLMGNGDSLYELYRLITKVAQTHVAVGGDINNSIYLLQEDTTLKEFLELLIDVATEKYDSRMYYMSFELSKDLAKALRIAEEKEDYDRAVNILANSYAHFEKKQDRQFYLLEKEALMECGYKLCGENTSKAINAFSLAVEDMNRLLLENHADTALLYYMQASCYKDQGEYELSYYSAKQSLSVYENAIGRNTPQAFRLFCILAYVGGKIGEYDEAFDNSDYAMDLAMRYYGDESEEYDFANQLCDEIVDMYVMGNTEKTNENS